MMHGPRSSVSPHWPRPPTLLRDSVSAASTGWSPIETWTAGCPQKLTKFEKSWCHKVETMNSPEILNCIWTIFVRSEFCLTKLTQDLPLQFNIGSARPPAAKCLGPAWVECLFVHFKRFLWFAFPVLFFPPCLCFSLWFLFGLAFQAFLCLFLYVIAFLFFCFPLPVWFFALFAFAFLLLYWLLRFLFFPFLCSFAFFFLFSFCTGACFSLLLCVSAFLLLCLSASLDLSVFLWLFSFSTCVWYSW